MFHLALLAPLVLLRSDASTQAGIQWFKRWDCGRHNYDTPNHRYWRGTILLLKASVVIMAVRIGAAFTSFLRHPIESLSQIPFNYQRYALCMDTLYPPEMLPGVEQYSLTQRSDDLLKLMRLANLLQRLKSRFQLVTGRRRVYRMLVFGLTFVLLFVPPLVLRFAVKATSILYVPFIFLCKGVSFDNVSYETRMRRLSRKSFAFYYALIGTIGLATILPIAVSSLAATIVAQSQNDRALAAILGYFTFVPTIERWNVVRLLCAMITVLLYIVARRTLADLQDDQASWLVKYETAVDSAVRGLNTLRGIGVMYVILCGALLLWNLLADVTIVLPTVGRHWFP